MFQLKRTVFIATPEAFEIEWGKKHNRLVADTTGVFIALPQLFSNPEAFEIEWKKHTTGLWPTPSQ